MHPLLDHDVHDSGAFPPTSPTMDMLDTKITPGTCPWSGRLPSVVVLLFIWKKLPRNGQRYYTLQNLIAHHLSSICVIPS